MGRPQEALIYTTHGETICAWGGAWLWLTALDGVKSLEKDQPCGWRTELLSLISQAEG